MTRSIRLVGVLAAMVAMGCRPGGSLEDDHSRHDGQNALVPGAGGPVVVDSATGDSLSRIQPGALGIVAAESVRGWTGPGGRSFEVLVRTDGLTSATARLFGTVSRRNSARERSLGQYPCTSCHLGQSLVLRDERRADVHQDIVPLHPAQTGATCGTCHSPDNVELLTLKSGERASLDHTYRLCAQCHFAQASAWAGGAHGKRLDGWQGRRVVMGCADCHDPHRPAIGSRIPFRAPRLERQTERHP